MTQPDFLTITHSKDFTLFVSASLDDFNDFRHYFQDVERSRNVNEQELCLVKNQKESVLRVKVPVVERSRNDIRMFRSTTSMIQGNTYQDVERSRNVIGQDLILV